MNDSIRGSTEAIAKTLRGGWELIVIRNADGVGAVLEAAEPPTAVSAPPRSP